MSICIQTIYFKEELPMSMFQTTTILDGTKNGIAAYIKSRKQWIKRSDGRNAFFPNFETLEARLFREQDLNYHDVEFYFLINELPLILTKVYPQPKVPITFRLSDAVRCDIGWKICRYEVINGITYLHVYILQEVNNHVVTNIGYIDCRMNGVHDDNHDARFEYKKLKTIRSMVTDAITNLAEVQGYGVTVKKSNFGIDAVVDHTTAHIHIWQNSRLMDYNTEIKKMRTDQEANDYRCLPFLKDKDKYGTMYMFITCEDSDSQCNYTRTRADQVQENFMLYLQDLYPDEKFIYVPCKFMGKIILSREVYYGTDNKNRS